MVALTVQLMEKLKDSGKEMVKGILTEVLTAASMDVTTDEHWVASTAELLGPLLGGPRVVA